jgi:hypothetical protein
VKKPGRSTSGSFPTGPSLTPKQKAERDRAEAAKARGEAAKAREEAHKAGELAKEEERRAKADRAKGEYAYAREEMREARNNLARERRDLARAGRDTARARRDIARARTAGLARPSVPGEWILGGNDRYLTCAAAAVANSLLAATGIRVADEDVLALHAAAAGSPDAGASVLAVLEAAERYGLGGVRPDGFGAGTQIAELALPGGIHAVLLADGLAVSWGRPVAAAEVFPGLQILAAWAVTWA